MEAKRIGLLGVELPIDEFVPPERAAGLNIVSYATTPVPGAPDILARAISAHTPHTARCVWARSGYDNGVVFGGGIVRRLISNHSDEDVVPLMMPARRRGPVSWEGLRQQVGIRNSTHLEPPPAGESSAA